MVGYGEGNFFLQGRGGEDGLRVSFMANNSKGEEGADESTVLVVSCLVRKRGEVKVGM